MSRQGKSKSFQQLVLLSQGQLPFTQFLLPVSVTFQEDAWHRGVWAVQCSWAGGFAVMCDSGAVTVCIQGILQIHCKKSGDNIRNSQSSEPYLLFVSPAPGLPGEVLPNCITNSTFLEDAGCCFTQSCVSGEKSGDCELGQFSLRNSLYLQGCGSFILCQN